MCLKKKASFLVIFYGSHKDIVKEIIEFSCLVKIYKITQILSWKGEHTCQWKYAFEDSLSLNEREIMLFLSLFKNQFQDTDF